MNKYYKLLLILSLTLNVITAYSQWDFRPGYIINNNGDSLNGLISFSEGAMKYKICHFKNNNADKIEKINPDQIRYYRFNEDRLFKSKDIPLSDTTTQKVFLEVLAKGKITLYRNEMTFFIEKEGDPKLYVFTNELKPVQINGYTIQKKDTKQIGVLSYLLGDCFEVADKMNISNFGERSLTSLVNDYNTCMGQSSITYKKRKAWIKGYKGVSLGINRSSIKFGPDKTGTDYLFHEFTASNSIQTGITGEIFSPKINERFSFTGSLLFSSSNYHSYSVSTSNKITDRYDVEIDLKGIKIPVGIRYTFFGKKIKPIIDFGVSGTYNFIANSYLRREHEVSKIVDTYEDKALEINKSLLGFWIGGGLKIPLYRKTETVFLVSYELINGIRKDLHNFSISRENNIQFMINLYF
jgi:hypothetical protein